MKRLLSYAAVGLGCVFMLLAVLAPDKPGINLARLVYSAGVGACVLFLVILRGGDEA